MTTTKVYVVCLPSLLLAPCSSVSQIHYYTHPQIVICNDEFSSITPYMDMLRLAKEVQRGANAVQGVEATLWQVPETLSNTILQKVKAPPRANDVAEIRPEQLLEADGFLFGFPSRFGVMASRFGAGTFAADGYRQPTELELQQAFYRGKYVAEITKKLKNQPLSL